MGRMALSLIIFLTAAGVVWEAPVHAAVPDSVRKALKEHFQLSRVAVESELVAGRVFNPRTVLLLQADGIPAKTFRVVQHLPKWPRFHGRDDAPVTIAEDGQVPAGPGDFSVGKGTRLVVLDLKNTVDRVQRFTHTLEPVRRTDGKASDGRTEFIFPFTAGELERADLSASQRRIEPWLPLASAPQSAASLASAGVAFPGELQIISRRWPGLVQPMPAAQTFGARP
ncbi:MAG: hypothetical protein ACRERE_40545 [Candidatus Entotheonellia bacterium]